MSLLNLLASFMIVSILCMVFYGTVRVILWDVSQRITLVTVGTCLLALISTLGICFGANAAPISFIQASLVCVVISPWVLAYRRADVLNSRLLRVRVHH